MMVPIGLPLLLNYKDKILMGFFSISLFVSDRNVGLQEEKT